MMRRAESTRLFLIFALLLANIHSYQGSPLLGCEPNDSRYEERRQELADEIEDVNDYMRMVADQLTNDGVVVVRAIKTRITSPDTGDEIKQDIGSPGFENPESEEIISTDEKIDYNESQNLLPNETELLSATEMTKSYIGIDDLENEFLPEKSQYN